PFRSPNPKPQSLNPKPPPQSKPSSLNPKPPHPPNLSKPQSPNSSKPPQPQFALCVDAGVCADAVCADATVGKANIPSKSAKEVKIGRNPILSGVNRRICFSHFLKEESLLYRA